MRAFAKPEEAVPYTYTDFPAPERAKIEFSFADNPASKKFVLFDADANRIQDASLPVVQGLLLQDFKEVISRVS